MIIRFVKEKGEATDLVNIRLLEMLLTEPHISMNDLQKIKAKTLVLAGEKDIIMADNWPRHSKC